MASKHHEHVGSGLPDHDLEDLIARHFDGALDCGSQRRLAALLAESSLARDTLARYLRLEGGLIRLASAAVVDGRRRLNTGCMPRRETRVAALRRRWWLRPSYAGHFQGALIGVGMLAVVIGWVVVGTWSFIKQGHKDLNVVAELWLMTRTANTTLPSFETAVDFDPVDQARTESGPQELPTDDLQWIQQAPPAWLITAVADVPLRGREPDEG